MKTKPRSLILTDSDSTHSQNNHHSSTGGKPLRTTGGSLNLTHHQTHVQTNSANVDKILKKLQVQSAVRQTDYSYLLKEAKAALLALLEENSITIMRSEKTKTNNYVWEMETVVPLERIKELWNV